MNIKKLAKDIERTKTAAGYSHLLEDKSHIAVNEKYLDGLLDMIDEADDGQSTNETYVLFFPKKQPTLKEAGRTLVGSEATPGSYVVVGMEEYKAFEAALERESD